jgi:hypothetical protein
MHYFKVKIAEIVYSEEIISISSDESEDADIQFFDENFNAGKFDIETLDDIMDHIDSKPFYRRYNNHCDFNINFFDSNPNSVVFYVSPLGKEDYQELSDADKIKIVYNQSINRGD